MTRDPRKLVTRQAREKLEKLPKAISECAIFANNYGRCVVSVDNLKKDTCLKEFNLLKNCVNKALAK